MRYAKDDTARSTAKDQKINQDDTLVWYWGIVIMRPALCSVIQCVERGA